MKQYVTELLSKTHNRNEFSCGNKILDFYLHKIAGQDVKRKLAACFVLSEDSVSIKGFYTLSSASIHRNLIPGEFRKKYIKTYENLPVTLLGRLAVSNNNKGQGIGELLLIDALKRCFNVADKSIGSIAVIVDPIDENSVKFYEKYGFTLLPGSKKMFISMMTIKKLFK